MSEGEGGGAFLTEEKRLWHIYKASRRIKHSRFNTYTTLAIAAVLTLGVELSTDSAGSIESVINSFSQTGLILAITTLGFLIAGFTIFSTVSSPAMLVKMAEIENPESGLPWIKHIYFIFMRVFVYYLVFSVYCLFVIIFTNPGFSLEVFSINLFGNSAGMVAVKAAYVVLFSGYYFLLVQLKSFIFNVYHCVMTSLRWEFIKDSKSSSGSDKSS